ncbi:fatty acid cis/trans isomerase [Desulfosarcina variabilis]|uniref:fatty acid cis/trans isomerase n=1 Tax=Desulfosarcina variabilis TaxID=2300 RepID=UPI003AFB2E70
MRKVIFLIVLLMVVMTGCNAFKAAKLKQKYGPVQSKVDRLVAAHAPGEISFYKDVQPILERRCSVCHSCYDAPCQLKTTCFEGIERGGTKALVYNAARLTADTPTRLHVDADSVQEWRNLGFHPVLNERDQVPVAQLENSLLNLMLQLKKDNPLPQTDLLPQTFDIRLDHEYICTTVEDFPDFKEKYSLWGMPYALPALTDEEREIIVAWLRQGARIAPKPKLSDQSMQVIGRWETFMNGTSLKERLMSRYLYEHLFIGRIHFESMPEREFYRLVRSTTPPGQPVVEINTIRPYADPGPDPFYYRFRRLERTIAVKDHTVYHMTADKMARYRELFLEKDVVVTRLPGYDPATTANPFKTFAELPALSRYRFMLDDARFFVEGFIKGPVCRGQVALNVINDHFFVVFFDPEKDTISNDTRFLSEVSDLLGIPSERKSTLRLLSTWHHYAKLQKEYLVAKEKYLMQLNPDDIGNDISYVWDGDGINPNALLTVFRHFDSASVVNGFVGKMPKTGWVIDYPLFERIHYLLVAGFNVYGNLGHQLETRLYMDFLRMEGENNFLSFLPINSRREIWADWYTDAREGAENYLDEQFRGLQRTTRINYHTDDPKTEFFHQLIAYAGKATDTHDILNRCPDDDCFDKDASPAEKRADRAMRKVANIHGLQVQALPDVTFVHVDTGKDSEDLAYTIIRNKALSNNSMLFREDRRRVPENDTLTVVKGHVGSYPNAFSRIFIDEIEDCIERYLKIKDALDYYNFAKRYGTQRNSPIFWQESDWHYRKFGNERPVEAGVFDMYRFHRIAEKSDAQFTW